MAGEGEVSVKISYGGQIRRFYLAQHPLSFGELKEQIASLFPLENAYLLTYSDGDRDKIVISSDLDLQKASSVMKPIIRLLLENCEPNIQGSFLATEQKECQSVIDLKNEQDLKEKCERIRREMQRFALSFEKDENARLEEELRKREWERRRAAEKAALEEQERAKRKEEELEAKKEKERKEHIEREEQRIKEEEAKRKEVEEQHARELEQLIENQRKNELEQFELQRRLAEEEALQRQRERENAAVGNDSILKEQERDQALRSNPKCEELLLKLLEEGLDLDLVWRALELSDYSDEKLARSLLEMNELGLDMGRSRDALRRFNGNMDQAVDSLMQWN